MSRLLSFLLSDEIAHIEPSRGVSDLVKGGMEVAQEVINIKLNATEKVLARSDHF
jgi:hypothetical protein